MQGKFPVRLRMGLQVIVPGRQSPLTSNNPQINLVQIHQIGSRHSAGKRDCGSGSGRVHRARDGDEAMPAKNGKGIKAAGAPGGTSA